MLSLYLQGIASELQFGGDVLANFSPVPTSIESEERFGKQTISQIIDQPGTSVFVPSQLPQFVREDHPRFVSFLETYYRWLDEDNNIGEKIQKIKEQQDIDLAKPEFAEQFYREFLVNIPRTVLTDKKILLKHIRQFYRAKGTEKSYRLFFRMLFNTSVDFYYPSTDILKVSDGKWYQQRCLRVIPLNGNMSDFTNTKIVGRQNGVVAYVDHTRKVRAGPHVGYELILNISSITGKFLPNEIISTEDGKFFAKITPIPTTYRFIFDREASKYKTGNGYKIGDVFDVKNATGRGARIKITSIIPTQRVEQDSVITEEKDENVEQILLGNKIVSSILKIICANDDGNYIAPPRDFIGTDDNGIIYENVKVRYQMSEDSDGNVYLNLNPFYQKPKGRILVQYEYLIEEESGSVDKIRVINFGLGYTSFDNKVEQSFTVKLDANSCVTDNFTGQDAEVDMFVSALGVYPGFYVNEDGHLSASKVIADGEYYQQYSYETITNRTTEEYRQALKNMVHPAGFKFFGKFRNQNRLDMRASISNHIRREFKQFHRPDVPEKSSPIRAVSGRAQTQVAVVQQAARSRVATGFGPTNYSIFRERFNYKPMERYNASSEVDGINSNYWGDRTLLSTQFANTSIQKFMSMVPVTLEGVPDDVQASLRRIPEHMKSGLSNLVRGDMIFNSTHNIVELYDGVKWLEVAPNKRINMLPDSVVSTTTTEE